MLRYPRSGDVPSAQISRAAWSRRFEDKGGQLFADSPVIEIEELRKRRARHAPSDGAASPPRMPCSPPTRRSTTASAMHSKMAPYRTYAMAFTHAARHPARRALLGHGRPLSLRPAQSRPGHGRLSDRRRRRSQDPAKPTTATCASRRSRRGSAQLVPDLGKEVHRWSGQVLDTIDYCGFIGRNPGSDNVYRRDRRFRPGHDPRRARGHSAQGPDHRRRKASGRRSTSRPARRRAARQLRQRERHRDQEFRRIPDARRDRLASTSSSPARAASSATARARSRPAATTTASCICARPSARISAAIVHWNSTEQCWDCPCHGSHFAPDGAVLNGPAIMPLEPAEEAGAKERRQAKAET